MGDIQATLQTLKGQRSRIDAAIAALEALGGKPKAAAPAAAKAEKTEKRGNKGHISEQGLQRIRAAQKVRWAKFRAAKKSSGK